MELDTKQKKDYTNCYIHLMICTTAVRKCLNSSMLFMAPTLFSQQLLSRLSVSLHSNLGFFRQGGASFPPPPGSLFPFPFSFASLLSSDLPCRCSFSHLVSPLLLSTACYRTWCNWFCLTTRCGRGSGGKDHAASSRFTPE